MVKNTDNGSHSASLGPSPQDKSFLSVCLDHYKQRSFLNAYDSTFELLRADTPELKERVFQLRYDVFCRENKFEHAPYDDDIFEYDAYDDRAVHFLLMHKPSGEPAGTLRLILPNDEYPSQSFPVQKLARHPLLRSDSKILTLCEISRFCMASRFRRRERDGRLLSAYCDQDVVQVQKNGRPALFRRLIPYAPAALLRGAFEAALEARITEGLWMVDTNHLESLKKIGFECRPLGPHVNHHGGQQPVIFNIKHVLDHMRRVNPHCWEVISGHGRLHELADTLQRNDWQDHLLDAEDWDRLLDRPD
jgi:N-acyl amino acid synthase of PEP-CTERM/exosortase system